MHNSDMRSILLFSTFLVSAGLQSQECGFILSDTETAICGEAVHIETTFTENLHSMYFNGTTSRLESIDRPEYHLEGEDFTLAAWVKIVDHNGRFDILSKPSSTWASHGAYDMYIENGLLKFTIRHMFGAPWYSHLVGPAVPMGEWHHVAAVADVEQGAMRLYLDGVEAASRNWVGTLYMNSQLPLYIGCHYKEDYPGQYFGHFKGRMDDVSIWKRTFDEEALQELMLCKSGLLNDPDLISLWDFHEGTGQFSEDLSTFQHQATLLFSSAFVQESPYGKGPYTVNWSTGETGSSIDVLISSDMLISANAYDIQGNLWTDEVMLENVPDGFTQEIVQVCMGEPYVFPDGYSIPTVTAATSYYSELQTLGGCDSAVMTMLVPTQINNSLSLTQGSISCTNQADAYQWFTCGDEPIAIPGATQHTFYPSENGTYSVRIEKNGCNTYSDCIDFTFPIVSGLMENELAQFYLYPNPNNGRFNLWMMRPGSMTINIYDIRGALKYSVSSGSQEIIPVTLDLESGLYAVHVLEADGMVSTQRLLIQK